MTVGGRYYSDADMLRMQRDAEARVRDMQAKARRTVEEANTGLPPPPQRNNRNWNSGPNVAPPTYRQVEEPRLEEQRQADSQEREAVAEESAPGPEEAVAQEEASLPPEAPPQKDSTVIGDIMNALNLDSDYLLIGGLILILINQRADPTLILALAYLLLPTDLNRLLPFGKGEQGE